MDVVTFNYITKKKRPREIKVLKVFLAEIFKREKTKLLSLNYIFCSDVYLLQINMKYLQHNYFTDIITFSMSDSSDLVVGEIYISIDRVSENAQFYEVSFQNELQRVIIHGALHLCGYKDKTKAQKSVMRALEDKYMNLLAKFISRGTLK
ncbi:MAG: rRNA maturation RNase YbeY [Sphingobacteriales bacterium]|nr:rRNA maturation RNase YbeY [Sphingobacteriales bacterium]